jgi:integrase/recombinase XerD
VPPSSRRWAASSSSWDFSTHLTRYLTHYLAAQRNLSPNTIRAYRDVFTLLLRFCRDQRGIALERLCLAHIDSSLVEAFLDYLAKERHVSIGTQNQRLAVLHSFFRYVQSEVPEIMLQCQRILAIPLQRSLTPTWATWSRKILPGFLHNQTSVHRRGVGMLCC